LISFFIDFYARVLTVEFIISRALSISSLFITKGGLKRIVDFPQPKTTKPFA